MFSLYLHGCMLLFVPLSSLIRPDPLQCRELCVQQQFRKDCTLKTECKTSSIEKLPDSHPTSSLGAVMPGAAETLWLCN